MTSFTNEDLLQYLADFKEQEKLHSWGPVETFELPSEQAALYIQNVILWKENREEWIKIFNDCV